jgi:phosphinothricin acetyltransferase
MCAIRSAVPGDLPGITAIYNDAILKTTATFHTEPRTADEQRQWFASHDARHPIVVAHESGEIIGWASLSPYSDRPAYAETAEVSVYVREDRRGRGIGALLMREVLAQGRALSLHAVVARIVGGNEPSVRLHASAGFERVGVLREVGRKFGRLLDVLVMELVFPEARRGP